MSTLSTYSLHLDNLRPLLPIAKLNQLWEQEKLENDTKTYGETGKYILRLDEFLKEKVECFRAMGLETRDNKQILDIGAGVGYFPWLCKHFGHTCDFTDCMPPKFYKLVWTELGLNPEHIELCIAGGTNFSLPRSYDIITAHRTVFDMFAYHWYVDEYKNFLRNCAEYLHDDGFVFIKTNLGDHHLHRPHPAVAQFFDPYRVEGFNSITFKMTKQQIAEATA